MALAPINPTQLTPPRVDLIDPRSGAISREWYRFFLSLLNATESNQSEVELAPDTASLLATYDSMLETLTQTTETQPDTASLLANYDAMLETLAQTTESEPDASSFAVGVEKQLYDFQNTVLTEPRTEYVDTASAVASLQVLTWLGL
jgi:hypothetical protein